MVSIGPASECGDLPHPLDAVDHEGVNVPHTASNLVAKTFDARVGEEWADSHRHQEWRKGLRRSATKMTASAMSSPPGIRTATIIGEIAWAKKNSTVSTSPPDKH